MAATKTNFPIRARATGAERSSFLNQACGGDAELRSEVESLISSHNQAGDSIEGMAAEAATKMPSVEQGSIEGKQIGHYHGEKTIADMLEGIGRLLRVCESLDSGAYSRVYILDKDRKWSKHSFALVKWQLDLA